MGDPELVEYLAQRFSVAGSSEECVEQFARLAEAGAKQFYLATVGPDSFSSIRTVGRKIIPAFQ